MDAATSKITDWYSNQNPDFKFSEYNGQQVRADDGYKSQMADLGSKFGMSAEDYDKMTNPGTYGARWGSSAPMTASTPASAPAPSYSAGSTSSAPSLSSGNVSDWYHQYLGRDPEAGASDFWTQQAAKGVDVQSAILNSPEYKDHMAKMVTAPTQAATLSQASLQQRTIDPTTETVQGQLKGLLADDSPYLQQAQARAMRTANERGLLNSSMAATAGTDAAISNALNIAAPDAATYGHASDYNTALHNQTEQYNVDQINKFGLQKNDMAMQRYNTDKSAETSRYATDTNAATSRYATDTNAATSKYSTDTQASTAQLQSNTQRLIAELNNNTSRYQTDASYKQQMDNTKLNLTNSIINNMDLSPDRKSELLKALGQDGLAGAIYVIDKATEEIAPASNPATREGN